MSIKNFRTPFQNAACMLLSVIIVTASLAIGALAADYAAPHGRYSVTITQLA